MINITVDGVKYKLRNEFDEIKIFEFEYFNSVLQDDSKTSMDKYIDIFTYLGLGELMDEIDSENLITLIKSFNNTEMTSEFVKSFELNGYNYIAYTGDNFVLKGKDMALIESLVTKNGDKFIGEMLAVIFKREDLTKVEHYDTAHIKEKAKQFRNNITMDIAIPYVAYISDIIGKQLIDFKETNGINS